MQILLLCDYDSFSKNCLTLLPVYVPVISNRYEWKLYTSYVKMWITLALLLKSLRSGAECCSRVCRRDAVLTAAAFCAHQVCLKLLILLWVPLPSIKMRNVKVATTASVTWIIIVHLICKLLSKMMLLPCREKAQWIQGLRENFKTLAINFFMSSNRHSLFHFNGVYFMVG